MGLDVNSINWLSKNLVDVEIIEWSGSGASPGSDYITLSPGGYIEHTLEKITDSDSDGLTDIVSSSNYIKMGLDIVDTLDGLSNYTNDIDIKLVETYKSDDSDFRKSRTRVLSTTPANAKDMGSYFHLVFLMEMLGKPLAKLKIRITNKTDSSRSLKWIGLYASQDIGTYQYSQVQKDSAVRYGTFIEARTTDPVEPEVGRIWLRTDLESNVT